METWLYFGHLQRVDIWERYFAELAVIAQFYRIEKGRHNVE